jgi:hypothetical protein
MALYKHRRDAPKIHNLGVVFLEEEMESEEMV